jgi:anion-transporting  ArsA/GET3 family ATPase
MNDIKIKDALKKLDDTLTKQKSIANKLVDEHKQLQEALAIMLMCCNADEDCPSKYRTEHFKSAITDGYDLLKKVGYFKNKKKVL